MIVLTALGYIILSILGIISCYLILGVLIPLIPSSLFKESTSDCHQVQIFIKSDGIHTDYVLPTDNGVFNWKSVLSSEQETCLDSDFLELGWGDKGFYLDIPTWNDITFKVAFNAMCRPSPTVMHVTPLDAIPKDTKFARVVNMTDTQYLKLCQYVLNHFNLNENGKVRLVPQATYGLGDNFYLGNSSYHAFKTCNEWVNRGLKISGVRTAIWSPGAFGIFFHDKSLKDRLRNLSFN